MLEISKSFDSFLFSNRKKPTTSVLCPPLGLLYIGRSLEDEGHKVEFIDVLLEKHPMETIKRSLQNADVVGIKVLYCALQEAASTAQNIKEIDPSIPIIIGGPQPTYHATTALDDIKAADISLEGEGELAVKEIAQAIQGDKKLSEIPGVFYRENNTIKRGKAVEFIKDLDSIQFPARHLADKYNSEYGKINNGYFFKPPVTSIATSRGCPFVCRFCSRHVSEHFTAMKYFRQRSAENVVEEIFEINDKYGCRFLRCKNIISSMGEITQ